MPSSMATTSATSPSLRYFIISYLIATTTISPLAALAAPREPLHEQNSPAIELLVSVRSGKDMAADRGAAAGPVDNPQGSTQPSRIYKTPSRAKTQQVRVLEGHDAYISHSESVPYPSVLSDNYPDRVYPILALEYRELKRGFAVRPYFSGSQLLLDISASSDRWSQRGGSVIDGTVIKTTIRAEMGQWIRLGGTDETDKTDKGKPGIYQLHKSTKDNRENEIWVRVERID